MRQPGLLVVDVQERLFAKIDRAEWVGRNIERMVRAFGILDLLVELVEQVPLKLGPTIPSLRMLFAETPRQKSRFSAVDESLLALPVDEWVVVGIEAHVCVLQTCRDLIAAGKRVVVLNDAVGSRSIFDYSTAIAEMREMGARISSVEILLFELLESADHPKFKQIGELVK